MATEENHPFAFGQYLRDLRLERGVSLETISARTRIGMGNLLAIEREDHQRLPAVVFVVGYLKAYAQVIGAEPGEAIRRYHASRRAYNDTLRTNAVARTPERRPWFRLGAALGLLAMVIGLSIFAVKRWQSAARPPATVVAEAPPPAAQTLGEGPERGPSAAPAAAPAEGFSESPPPLETAAAPEGPRTDHAPKSVVPLALGALAVEETWLKVISDNQRPVEYLLKPGQTVSREARSGFNLLIGNAAGLRLTLNGQPVRVPGKSGQVVTLQLP